MSESKPHGNTQSPPWSTTTKLVVGLTVVAIVGALLVQVKNIIGPLILAFVLTFLLHPVVCFLVEKTRLSWQAAVNVVFLLVLILLIGFLTATGLAIVNQLQNLIGVVQNFVTDLPNIAKDFISQEHVLAIPILDIQFNVNEYISQLNIDLLALSEQILSLVQPFLGQAGGVLGTVATSALNVFVMGGFILIISYFTLAETGKSVNLLQDIEISGLAYDLRRMGLELTHKWNAFLRGQFMIFIISVFAYVLLLSILGVSNALGLAFLAGLAKFIPYLGPIVTGVITALVAFFQQGNYLGIEPITYALIVVIAAVLLDQVFDALVTPRLMASTLGVHPAAVLVSAIIAARLLGLIGLLLAAPVLASVLLLAQYTTRKMLDRNPWPEPEPVPVKIDFPLVKSVRRLWGSIKERFPRSKGKKNE